MSDSSQDKNLPATERRLDQAKKDGQMARSRDLANLSVLGGGAAMLIAFWPTALGYLRDFMRHQLRFDHELLQKSDVLQVQLTASVLSAVAVYLPLGLAVLLATVFASIAVGGWSVSVKPLMPDLNKISPLAGFGRIFSKQQFFEVLKLVALTTVIATVAWVFISTHLAEFSTLLLRPLDSALSQLGSWLVMGTGALLVVVGVVAGADIPLSIMLHKHRLRMSHEEVKQEHKETEGNPQLKGRMRALQREVAQRNSVAAVPQADLVVMNPTHYAVAIRYDETSMAAPRVIAKGADLVAMRIRDVAKGCSVPVLQSPMLARALYAHAEIGSEIPPGLYNAVAQVLAYVYQLKAALKGQGPMPQNQPVPDVPRELDPHHVRDRGAAKEKPT
ncbi:MAG: EscU/YscU/HrcU family type III secretion system export apparatus switch protein [Burkholderiaceae bacterium]|nr:EscU/YscU/HrcU family type III secretion system export apparatus switch protein [Burkholderiaceae bacterium]